MAWPCHREISFDKSGDLDAMNLNDPSLLRVDSYVNGAWTTAAGDKRFAVTF